MRMRCPLIPILTACLLLLSLPALAADEVPIKGLNCVFFAPRVPARGEMTLIGIHKRVPAVAEKAGIVGHSQVELTLDASPAKMAAQVQAALSGERVDVLALTVSGKILRKVGQFAAIMDEAVKINPKMKFVIQTPGTLNVPVRKVSKFATSVNRFHIRYYKGLIVNLRQRYPSNLILCANYGRAGGELKERFEDDALPGITELVGPKGIFLNDSGAPGPILDDLHAMLTVSLIYGIDLREKGDLGLGYKADMGAILKPVARLELKHASGPLEPLPAKGPNIYSIETWERPWGYTVPVTGGKGIKGLLWGHLFSVKVHNAVAPFAKMGGFTGHSVTNLVQSEFRGAPSGAVDHGVLLKSGNYRLTAGPAGHYGPNTDYGKRDIIFLTYWQKATGVLNYYRIWMEHARIRNPKVRMLIYVPSTYMPVTRDLRLLNETNDALRTRFYSEVILPMRKEFPDNEILVWFSGRVCSELRTRFGEGKLPHVKQLVGPRGIFSTKSGMAGPLLMDLEGLILYSLIYKVDLPKTMTGQSGKMDLNALAAEMMAMEAKKGL